VNSAYDSPTGAGWYDSGSSAPFSVTSPVSGGTGIQYVCTGYSGDASGSGTSGSITMNGPKTITFNWKTQYQITFTSSGVGSDATGTVVTVNSNAKTQSQLPFTDWYDSGATINYDFSATVSAGTGKQYVWTSTSGLGQTGRSGSFSVAGAGTVTGTYKTQYYLTVSSAYDSPDPTSSWLDAGSSVTASVSSPVTSGTTRYVCTGWTGTGSVPASGSSTPVSFTINAPSSITWNWKTQYQLTMQANPSGGGTTTPTVGSYWYDSGSPVSISATAASGYAFSSWSGSGSGSYSGSSNPASVTMNAPITETANFQAATVSITITSSPTGSGFVKVDGNAITTPQTFTWAIGSSHTLEALSPVSGGSGTQYVWIAWSDGGAQSHSYTTPSSSQTVTANFKTQYYLTVDSAHGSPNPTSGWFDSGSSITASVASPVSGGSGVQYVCTGWTGSGSVPASGSENSVVFTINAPSSITWSWKTQYYLTMLVNPSGGGSVSPSSGWRDASSSVSISATPSSGYAFSSWNGSGSGSYNGTSNPASVTMNGPIAETANFQVSATVTVQITVTSSPTGSKYVKVDGFAISTPHTFTWVIGSTHTLNASSPVSGGSGTRYVFQSWSDGGAQSHSYTVPSSSQTVSANYETQYLLVVDTDPAGLSPQPSANPPEPSWYYDAGTSVNVMATDTISGFGSTFNFTRWKVDGIERAEGENWITVTMDEPHTAVACYQGPASPPSESESTSQIAFSMYDPIVAYGSAVAASTLCLALGKLRKGRNRER
jgi:hypothetical protein